VILKKKDSFFKNLLSRLLSKVEVWSFYKPRHIRVTPLKLIKRQIIDDLLKVNTSNLYISSLLFSVTKDVVNVSVAHEVRKYDKSGFTYRKMWQTFSNRLFNNSSVLIKLINYTGVFLLLLAGTFLVAALVDYTYSMC
jgi:hypothetical protein